LFRGRRQAPPLLLPSLDRLAELIERVVELLDEVTLAPEQKPREAPGPAAEVAVDGWIAFVSSPDGYRVLPQHGASPACGATIELERDRFRVVRLGRSPLPGDRRRCAFLEREEPRSPERTIDR
jgi:hypothetical protein